MIEWRINMLNKKDLANLEGLFMLYAVKTNDGKVMAAKKMNTSIDTLNKYLDILERELGSPLITVNDRRCSLTDFGEKAFSIAEQIISNLNQISYLREREKAIKGEVRIACDRCIKNILSFNYLEKFFNKYSDISLSIDICDSLQNLKCSPYDLYLSYDFPPDNNLVIIASKDSPCGFFASTEYLSTRPQPQNIEDILLHHRLILNRCWLSYIQNQCLNLQYPSKDPCLTNSHIIVSDMVNANGGIGILPLKLAQKSPKLIFLNQIKCDFNTKAYLISHKETKDLPRIRVVIDYYKNLLKSV